MKNKKIIIFSSLVLISALVSCGGGSVTSSQEANSNESNSEEVNSSAENTSVEKNSNETISPDSIDGLPVNKSSTIYLAGDSTVKTYNESQYIGGWGQYLDRFLTSEMVVANCSNGGRSSRSFINEGRLYDNPGSSYTFSENGGNSIGDVIKEGDFLMIQFGHNDDDTKQSSSYTTIYDRMVPLGEADENGIYPTTPGSKTATNVLPEAYTSKATDAEEVTALATIEKYGETYYAYDSGGTYKWFLKQYIDFAREKGATPVLVTPVARVKFSGGEIIGGAGLHGENFAYVQAVRQLAEEEGCLLIDLFADSKEILETATSTYANYLMALKPNDLNGEWPSGYDEAYGNTELGYTGIEATHYNKYGAFLQAGKVAEAFINTNFGYNHGNNVEYYSFKDYVLTTPESYIDPSNLLPKSVVASIEGLFDTVNVTNPNRTYADPNEVVSAIEALANLGEMTNDNYLTYKEECENIREMYYALNVDDRSSVTNLATLEAYEAQVEDFIEANRPKPISTTVLDFENLTAGTYTENIVTENYTIYADASKNVEIKESKANATYNGTAYSTTKLVKLGGSASYGVGRYISFEVTGACTISVMAKSSGSDERVINVVNSSYSAVGSLPAPVSAAFGSVDVTSAGTYSIGSTSGGVYIYAIVIEYFA